jgi:NAD-dependent deacetylase
MAGPLSELAGVVARARRILVLTGAGISAESGIPTFREAGTGFWARYDPMDLATPEAFARDPRLVWRWYQWRRGLIRAADPNPGHQALAALQARGLPLTLVTQNVDGLHQRAGHEGVVEFHGNIFRNRCRTCGNVGRADDPAADMPPECPACGSLMGPGVVWFGEPIPVDALRAADEAASACDVFFSVGTSALVAPASSLADAARQAGAVIVEINPETTDLTGHADFPLAGPAGVLLPALLAELDAGGSQTPGP